jgi:putative phosphoesterase
MRLGVVSDTHLPRFGRALPRALSEGLREARVDLILHLGDFTAPFVPALFEAVAPFDAVAGNNDGPALVERFGRRKILNLEGLRVALTHGDLGAGRTTPERALNLFAADDVRLVLCGHSHQPRVLDLGEGRWLVNPGSPTDRRRESRYSWALIDIVAGEARPQLRFFDERGP